MSNGTGESLSKPYAHLVVRWLALTTVLLWTSTALRGQTPGAEPLYGSLSLDAGFVPDPLTLAVMAGGGEEMIDVGDLGLVDAADGSACGRFHVTEAPSVRLDLGTTPGQSAPNYLRLYVDVPSGSGTDAALLVRQPDGSWRCRDDGRVAGYAGLMPVIDFERPLPGAYDIWVGTYDRTASQPATFYVTALRENVPGR